MKNSSKSRSNEGRKEISPSDLSAKNSNPLVYAEITKKIGLAAESGAKMAMFHYLVFKNYEKIGSDHPTEFCRRVGVPLSYATEFRKMVNLAELVKNQGALKPK